MRDSTEHFLSAESVNRALRATNRTRTPGAEFNPYLLQTVRDVLIRKYGILGAFHVADKELKRQMDRNLTPRWTSQTKYWWAVRQCIKGRLHLSNFNMGR